MLSSAAAGMPCLPSCYYCLPARHTGLEWRLLGGLLLFGFLVSACAGSWLDIESVCSTCCVCDMTANSAQVREVGGVGEVRRRSPVEAEERGGRTFELGQASSRFSDKPRHIAADPTSPRSRCPSPRFLQCRV
jgi:hypothetical protein